MTIEWLSFGLGFAAGLLAMSALVAATLLASHHDCERAAWERRYGKGPHGD
jgi:hypothetical protein